MIDEKQLQEWRRLADQSSWCAADVLVLFTAVPQLLDEVSRLNATITDLQTSLTGALARIRELEGMLEMERSTDDVDNEYVVDAEC